MSLENQTEIENGAPETEDDEMRDAAQKKKALEYLDVIKAREKEFETGWWKSAKNSYNLYAQPAKEPGEKYSSAYNILYSNTEVLVPSLYSATAKPDVRARFRDTVLKPIPEVIERFLVIATDGCQPGAESFDDAIKDTVLSSLVAASGVTRLRLYEDQEFPLQYESVAYKDFLWGKAKKWARVPWISFAYDLTKEEVIKQFKLSEDEYTEQYFPGATVAGEEKKTCRVYEYWCKETREVWFLSEDWRESVLYIAPDPMGLKGFFPTPGPLLLTLKPGELEPIPLYEYYRNQAEELNRVTTRLNKVLSAIRVRGAYSSLLGDDMAKILADGEMENGLVPASESAMLAQGGGFEKLIWMLPLDKLIAVATQLYQARAQIKQVIYELTGISDIIRGSNVASETATATTTKDKWGTIRLRKMQTAVANYVRDLFRLSVDCGAAKVPAETWKKLVQLPIPLQAEKEAAQQQMTYQMSVAAAQGQQPQPDPKIMQLLQTPSLEEVLQKINSDVDRTFTINIQTSSTVDLDTSQDKAEVSEFMNAMGQLLAGLQPLAALGPTGLEAAKTILVSVCKRYKFGLGIVDSIEAIQPPPPQQEEKPTGPPPPSPEETAAIQAEAQAKLAKVQADLEIIAAKKEYELAKIAHDREMLAIELERAQLSIAASKAKVTSQSVKQNAPLRNPV